MKLTPKVRKTLDIVIQLSIAILSLSYIFYRLYSLPFYQVNEFFNSVLASKNVGFICLLLVLLMIINWGIESFKWKLLINQSEEINLRKAFQAILGGLAVSVFTPNRVGEFVGRVFILKKTNPSKAILLTIVGSFGQLLITIVLGTGAFVIFASQFLSALVHKPLIIHGISILLIIISVLLVFIFFNISLFKNFSILFAEKYAGEINRNLSAIADCPKRLLGIVLSLSALRYVVFSAQFYLAIKLVGLNFTMAQSMMVIPVIYLMLVAIPTVALSEIGVRGSVSVFLFGLLTVGGSLNEQETLAVISASTLIWVLNIAIPSLTGVLLIFNLKFFRR